MKKALLLLALLIPTAGFAADNQAFLGMFAETSVSKMAGMPAMPPLPPGIDLDKMPGMETMMGMGAPKRQFNIRLWSPSIAPKEAFAYVTPPDGLKQGKRLDLELYRPEPEKVEAAPGEKVKPGEVKVPEFTIKYYWGSSEKVKPGQPKVFSMGDMTPEQKRVMSESAKRARSGGESYFYKPDWTTAYWPTSKQPGKISKDASLLGPFALTTNYTGNVSIDCPSNVDFLAPIDMTSPDLTAQIEFEPPIKFVWKAIPNLLGSHAMITGMEGMKTLVIWSSSEVWSEEMMSVDWGYLQMADVRKYVESTVMMKGDRTDVIVPEGIFKDCDMANFKMVGYGPGVARDNTQPLPRIQTKTTLSIMLGGKGMPGMGEAPSPP